ncbi:MAG TPA: M4 family metallopeptidase [Parafilimonas sp.]|nr:M4 family metallopeptidase [Parafilimonas sp.]
MKRKFLSLLLLSFILVQAYAQNFISKEIRGERGISKQFISVDDDQLVNFNAAQVKSLLGLNANSDLVLKKTEQDQLGFIHYRYYQTYRSIPIENTMYIIHTKNGALKSLGGSIVTDFDQSIDQRSAQRLSASQAISMALNQVNAKQYAWQDAGLEQALRSQMKDLKASYKPEASLVWYNPGETINPRDMRLCYKIDIYAIQPLSRAYYFIDAITGKALGKKDRLQSSDVTGTAVTAYSGTQTIHSDKLGAGSFRLRDYSKGSGIITLRGNGSDYTSTSKNWTLGGIDIAALDAHFGISETYAYYYNVLGRNSYDGAGGALYSYVNAGSCDNAYWNGTYMTFLTRCDGNPGGVTGIDVAGHEVSHGVTQETSGLNYSYESGAMNESMSDIMGKNIQFWSKPTDIDWRLSNDMGWIIRNMSNPNAEGQPDTYHGTYWYTGSGDNGGVHYNSGVGNFMYYLLVNGGSGTNDNGDSYSVTGIGLDHAAKILYRTNAVYLVPTSQYADWRTACINAATDLYGAGSNELTQVQNAWHAVGIGAGGGGGCNTPTGLSASSITSTSATVSWGAATGAVKYKLQYRTGPPDPWTKVNNISTTSYNLTGLTPNTKYVFKVQSICAGGVKSAVSATKSFKTTNVGGYCAIQGSTGFEYIKRVKFGVIDNTSGNNGGYGDYTALSRTAVAGTTQQISLWAGFTSLTYSEYWEVYIDYNQDKDFDDAGERVAFGTSTGTTKKNLSFTIPLTAKNGTTRMRVVMNFNSYLNNPCGSFTDGEAEDYSVKFSGGTVNAVAESDLKQNTLNSLVVSPNPVRGSSASVVLQAAKAGSVNIKIADLSGRILRSENISSIVAGKNNYSLRNINLLPGTYMIIAQQGNAIIARTQFVVDK